jgi:ubiquinone/menaquinone biosynthesis C-methylase UbiE
MSEGKAQAAQVRGFYDLHPINEIEILAKLEAAGASLDNLTQAQLSRYDQDHYGGLDAVAELVRIAGIESHHHVLDVCSGMGGPARWIADTVGCRVTGLDLTVSRVQGATRLTQRVNLHSLVNFEVGDATNMPFADHCFDVCISEEGWLHIPDKPAVVNNCARVLKPTGTIAITDTTARADLSASEQALLADGMSAFNLQAGGEYVEQFEAAGLHVEACQDVSDAWTELLVERLAMYRTLRDTTVAQFGQAAFAAWDNVYATYVGLFAAGKLGGICIQARKKA